MDRIEPLYRLRTPLLAEDFYADLFVKRGKDRILMNSITKEQHSFKHRRDKLYYKSIKGYWLRIYSHSNSFRDHVYDTEVDLAFSGLITPLQHFINRLEYEEYGDSLSISGAIQELGIGNKSRITQLNILRKLFWERMRSLKPEMSLQELGRLTGGQDHSTITVALGVLMKDRDNIPLYLVKRFERVINRLDINKVDMIDFEKYDKENPHIWDKFVELAFEAKEKGFKKYSANGIFELIRWKTKEAGNDSYKLNNNYRADYARKMMREFSEFVGFFEIRELQTNRN